MTKKGRQLMPKFEDYRSDSEVSDIMGKFVEKYPAVFLGFDVGGIKFIVTQKKKSPEAMKLRNIGYPMDVFVGASYLVEIFEVAWKELDQKRKNLMVFHIMCAFPDGAFDSASKFFGKKVKPQITMYELEYAVTKGVHNWRENDAVVDPLEVTTEELAEHHTGNVEIEGEYDMTPLEPSGKQPVTLEGIADTVPDQTAVPV